MDASDSNSTTSPPSDGDGVEHSIVHCQSVVGASPSFSLLVFPGREKGEGEGAVLCVHPHSVGAGLRDGGKVVYSKVTPKVEESVGKRLSVISEVGTGVGFGALVGTRRVGNMGLFPENDDGVGLAVPVYGDGRKSGGLKLGRLLMYAGERRRSNTLSLIGGGNGLSLGIGIGVGFDCRPTVDAAMKPDSVSSSSLVDCPFLDFLPPSLLS